MSAFDARRHDQRVAGRLAEQFADRLLDVPLRGLPRCVMARRHVRVSTHGSVGA
ncbi:hypothetical protein ACFFYR_27975 [Paraburkholderia dipogonis]|uniref:hypothetical protein n=1 Tax=Paraburkholderia dipogonis TaxID=1211383 RepID=UPI00141B9C76|nr:hypothetical protein [Paraburkholderia dipogonis]